MTCALRRAAPDDAALLAQHRSALWIDRGAHPEHEIGRQLPVWAAWFRDTIAEGTYVAWIARDSSGAPVGSGGLFVRPAMPRPGYVADRDGRVHSMWVDPAMRRRGIATAIMAEIIAYARHAMLQRLVLHPSADGRKLYEKLGFIELDDMALPFPPA